jgi:hypothetical protein
MISVFKSSLSAISIVLLMACGGGGDGNASKNNEQKLELKGLYKGNSVLGTSEIYTLINSVGEFFTWDSNLLSSVPRFIAEGELHSPSGDSLISKSFSAFVGQINRSGSIEFYVDNKKNNLGKISIEPKKYGFLDYEAEEIIYSMNIIDNYDFNASPNLLDISGTWIGEFSYNGENRFLSKEIIINDNGLIFSDFSAPSNGLLSGVSCELNGNISPELNNGNYFNLLINFSNITACPLAGKSISAIGLKFANSDGASKFVIVSSDSAIYFSAMR